MYILKASFNNFFISKSNEFAYLSAKKFVENIIKDKSDKTFNCLCISGSIGVGKTHLLLSIKDELEKNNAFCKVLYINVEDFLHMLIDAIRTDRVDEFEQTVYNYDVFLFEDIHELSDKEATSKEFYQLLRNALSLDKKVAVTYLSQESKNPECMYNKYIMNIINSFLCININPPDNELLYRYYKANTANDNIEMTNTIERSIYECDSINELIGLVKKLRATKLKSAIIQEPVSAGAEVIEAELFQYHKTIIPEDIILTTKPLKIEALSETQLNEELVKGYSDYLKDNTKPADDVFNEIHKDYMKVNVKDIAERLEMLFDDYIYLLDKRTGEIFEIDEHYLRIAEESDEDDNFDEYREWEKKNIQDAIKFFQEEKYYISLPSKYDIHEYQIMEDFIYSLTNEGHINRLERAITGKGAFRRFKDTINYLGIEKDWYDFKRKALGKIAIEWCEDNDLDYEI